MQLKKKEQDYPQITINHVYLLYYTDHLRSVLMWECGKFTPQQLESSEEGRLNEVSHLSVAKTLPLPPSAE